MQMTAAALKRANELFNAGELDQAQALLDEVLLHDPNEPQALCIAATILKKAKKFPLAYSLAKRATELKGERPEPWNAFAHCAQSMWRQEEALTAYRKALQRAKSKQQQALYLNNIASVHIDEGDYDKAEPFLKQSLGLIPDDRLTRHNMGLVLLSQRKWKEAWPYYSASIGTETRRNVKYLPAPGEPTWDGTKGKTVAIYGEQGLGDEIVAASMYQEAIDDCAKTVIDCDHRLEGLFRRSFPKAKVYGTRWAKSLNWDKEDREIDYSISAFEIGRFYRHEDKDFSERPYLIPDPDRAYMWRSLFASKGKPVIGVAWTGGTWHNAAKYRCLDIKAWQPIFDSIDAHWVSLQYKDASRDIAGTPVVQYPHATLTKDYDDTAAMVSALDCVISVPTTVVHLAGALGVPRIVMQSSKPCWKFAGGLLWHPGTKLIDNDGDWARTVKETAQAVRALTLDSKK